MFDEEDERYEVGCLFPGECCMGHTDHFKSECYTPEMADYGNEWDEWMRERQDEAGAFNPASAGQADSNE